jgi:hypothetical protein
MTERFYDELAPFYHLLYDNSHGAIKTQSAALAGLLQSLGVGPRSAVLDAACGIGTQALVWRREDIKSALLMFPPPPSRVWPKKPPRAVLQLTPTSTICAPLRWQPVLLLTPSLPATTACRIY